MNEIIFSTVAASVTAAIYGGIAFGMLWIAKSAGSLLGKTSRKPSSIEPSRVACVVGIAVFVLLIERGISMTMFETKEPRDWAFKLGNSLGLGAFPMILAIVGGMKSPKLALGLAAAVVGFFAFGLTTEDIIGFYKRSSAVDLQTEHRTQGIAVLYASLSVCTTIGLGWLVLMFRRRDTR